MQKYNLLYLIKKITIILKYKDHYQTPLTHTKLKQNNMLVNSIKKNSKGFIV